MKKNLVVFVLVFWVPFSFAQVGYKQKQFVFSIPESPVNPAQAECDQGIVFISKYELYDIKPTFTGKFRISTIRTWNPTGKVLDNDIREIGDILICQDWQTYWPQRNLVPVYYEVTIGGRKYRAVGAGTSPNFQEFEVLPGGGQAMVPEGYPEPGVTYLNFTATVLPAVEGKPGGIFYTGQLAYMDGADRDYYDHGGIGVLQLLDPAAYVEPVLVTYEYTGNYFDVLEGDTSVYSRTDRVEARFTIDCALAHKAGDCKNLPSRDYLQRGAVVFDSIEFSAGPALLPTPDGRVDGKRFSFSTDADGRINSWDMDLSLDAPHLNVDTDTGLDSAWAIDGGATVFNQPGTWRIVENPD